MTLLDGTEVAPRPPMDETERACLLSTLAEAQAMIRAYDTKAQIVGVGFIFSITMIGGFLGKLPVTPTYDMGYLVIGFVMLMGPLVLFGAVLYPTRHSAPEAPHGLPSRGMLYMTGPTLDVEAYLRNLEAADWRREIVNEIARVSALRDIKRRRFVAGLSAAGGSFAIILASAIAQMAGFR